MGQEILTSRFSDADFERFHVQLKRETELLGQWFAHDDFAGVEGVAGFELEAWLVDNDFLPAPINEAYLAKVHTEWVSPELSRFNVEVNGAPQRLEGDALARLERGLGETWRYCRRAAGDLGADLVMVGILPSLREEELTLANMSRMKRYRALNEQVFRLRKGKPLHLDIVGREHLRTTHHDVMLESATTSFQIHLQVSPAHAVRFYNASLIASAATVGVSANSPFLFGRDLWDETRIPLFEQAVEVGGFADAAYGPMRRVSFGSGYARESLLEPFNENLEHFPPLLPMEFEAPAEARWDPLSHLRLHNGTIWRWNRPLIGFEPDGRPHLRIEHRVVPGGPTVVDLIADMAFYYGLVQYLATRAEAPEQQISFSRARDNFYLAARHGLDANVTWFEDHKGSLRALVLNELLPAARVGAQMLGLDAGDIRRYLGIIEARARSAQTGAVWQRAYAQRHGRDMQALTAAYVRRHDSGMPVHGWGIE